MKLVSYRDAKGDSFGVVTDGGIVDVGRAGDVPATSLREALEQGALDTIRDFASGRKADAALDNVTLLPPVPDPQKIVCVGLNYAAHAAEGGREPPAYPALFPRYANTLVGHGQPIVRPKVSETLDYEGELAFVVGKTGRHIPKEKAYDHVAGYSCFNDGSIREWQRHTSQFLPGKNFVGTGGFGPWLITIDEVPDTRALTLITRLNGEEMQHTGVDDLIFDVPAMVAYISTFTELVPGDVVVTGTPSGVGAYRKPPVWMKNGDTVEVDISGVGVLSNPVVDE